MLKKILDLMKAYGDVPACAALMKKLEGLADRARALGDAGGVKAMILENDIIAIQMSLEKAANAVPSPQPVVRQEDVASAADLRRVLNMPVLEAVHEPEPVKVDVPSPVVPAQEPVLELVDDGPPPADDVDDVAPVVPVVAAPVDMAPPPLSRVQQMREEQEKKAKYAVMEMMSEGLQRAGGAVHDRVGIKEGDPEPIRAIKINMALRRNDAGAKELALLLAPKANAGALTAVMEELATLPDLDLALISPKSLAALSDYTKEKYANVTGVARGGVIFDASPDVKADRPMTEDELRDGRATLAALKANWAGMPRYDGPGTLFRVLHTGTAEHALAVGGSTVKANPTSTSIAIDRSRLGEGKTACRIRVLNMGGEVKAPVDTRAMSTYVHEGEVLLPPDTRFQRDADADGFANFRVTLPD